ncbi:MAG: CHAT domain-containing protein [Bryobacteraceae bacterium]
MKQIGVRAAVWLAGLALVATARIAPSSRSGIDSQLDQFSAQGMHALANLEYRQAIRAFAAGAEAAKSAGNPGREQRFLNALAGSYLVLHEYRRALDVYEEARAVARRCGNAEAEAVVGLNLVSLYSLLGDVDAAAQELHEAQRALPAKSQYWAHYYARESQLALRMRDGEVVQRAAERGMDVADAQGNAEVRAALAEDLGLLWMERREFGRSEEALLESYRLRRLYRLPDVERLLIALSRLALERGQAERAVWLAKLAGNSRTDSPSSASPWQSAFALAQSIAAAGRQHEALRAYRKALDIATTWRQEIVPSQEIQLLAGIGLYQVASAYASLAAELGAREGSKSLMWKAFVAVEQTRNAALWEQSQAKLAEDAEYRGALVRWRSQEFWRFGNDQRGKARAAAASLALQKKLRTLENRGPRAPGASLGLNGDAGWQRLQTKLGRGDALLSFSVGEERSWLWAVTRDSFEQVPLEGRERLARALNAFGEAVRRGLPGAETQGEGLYRELFGGLSEKVRSRERWLLSLDDALLEAPLAAICRREGGVRRYLVQDHILEPVASVFLALGGKPQERPAELFLGVGDPIYNRADARWAGQQTSAAAEPGLELPRLPGSLTELERIGRQWNSQGTRARLLTGGAATPERFALEVAARPKVIHIAAHLIQEETDQRGFVLMPGGPTEQSAVVVRRPSEMFLMLSLRPDGRADGLTARSVGAFTLPGSLVVMSGCGTGLGTHQPGAGLAGFFKSWIAAGASGAIGTLWSIPDDASALFEVFYACFRQGIKPSAALREAQLALLAKGGWQSRPAFWGAWISVGRN